MRRQTVFVGLSTLVLAMAIGFLTGLELFGPEERQLYSTDKNATFNSQDFNQTLSFDGHEIQFFFEPWSSEAVIERGDAPDLQIDLEDGENTETQVVTLGDQSYRIYFDYVLNSEDSLTVYRVEQV